MKTKDQNPSQILAKNLTTKHKLQLEDGTWQRIKSISNGFYTRSKLIILANGLDICLLNSDKVETIELI